MIDKHEMTKKIKVTVSNIREAKDKNFVFYIYDSLLENLLNEGNTAVSHVSFEKDKNEWDIGFDLKVSKIGDLTWVLMRENLACIIETEPKVTIKIQDEESEGTGVMYIMQRYNKSDI